MNMMKMMKEAQKMQQRLMEEMKALELTGEAGGGKVKVTVNGEKQVSRVKLDPSVVNPADIETLEDLLTLAFRDATTKADAALQERVGGMAGGMPGMF
jgi:DNA-binding YbaB/EbfC family protein